MACKATAGASPLFEYLLLHREDSILSIKPQPQSTIHFTICEVGEEFRPEGQRSFHPDQVLKQIGSCQLRTDNASHVARTGPDRILSFVGVPGIRPRCLVLECARSAEAASKSVHQRIAFGFRAHDKTNVKGVHSLNMSADLTNTLLCVLGHHDHLPREQVKVQVEAHQHPSLLLLQSYSESTPRMIYKT